jgi:lysophospholipase L1-like esterase
VRILALGDSITEFVKKPVDNCPQGYRYELWKLLIDSGLEFDFVGTHNATAEWPGQDQYVYPTYKGKAFDNDNNAFGGWTSGDLLNGKPSDEWNGWQGKLGDWLAKVTPDAVLLHVGTNDSWSWVEPAVYLRNLSDILDLIQTKHPVAVIYLAKLIPFGSKLAATDGARVPLYNAELDALAASKRGRGKVVVVDQHAGYEPDVDNACDVYAVHPGLSGAQKMARKWRDALLADFPAR